MNYLRLIETINYALEISNADNRMQMRKPVVTELQSIVYEIQGKLGRYKKNRNMKLILDNLIYALDALDKTTLKVLTEQMKESVTSKLKELKEELCCIAFKDLVMTSERFEVNNQSKKVVREVVLAAKRGGLIC